VDPRKILTEVGVASVDALAAAPPARLEAVAVVHTRVSYAALHTAGRNVAAIAERASTHPDVELAVGKLADAGGRQRFGIWRAGRAHAFTRDAGGTITVEDAASWDWLGIDLTPWRDATTGDATLADGDAFEVTREGPYPDIFYRVATAFSNPTTQYPADIFLSFPDDVTVIGYLLPGAGELPAAAGFHGSLTRAATVSVVASQSFSLPPAIRSDDLADMFPALRGADASPDP
jgi:hypothetical protein